MDLAMEPSPDSQHSAHFDRVRSSLLSTGNVKWDAPFPSVGALIMTWRISSVDTVYSPVLPSASDSLEMSGKRETGSRLITILLVPLKSLEE
jgi:hypothetical protein